MNTYHYIHYPDKSIIIPQELEQCAVAAMFGQNMAPAIAIMLYTPNIDYGSPWMSTVVKNLPEELATFYVLKGAMVLNLEIVRWEVDNHFNGMFTSEIPIKDEKIITAIRQYFKRISF